MRLKPVRILTTLVLFCFSNKLVFALDFEEGSGGGGDDTLLDLEDGDIDDGQIEGSGGSWDVNFGDSPFSTHDSNNDKKEEEDYYSDNYDYLDAYINKDGDYEDDDLVEYLDNDQDSVVKFDDEHEIEITGRPSDTEEEQIVLNTSQIFIMVGSSFISFAIFMLTFFLCRRIITNKQRKALACANSPEKPPLKEPPIVKDYQKVPTSAQDIMKISSPRVNMYGDKDPENPSSAPLVP